MLQQTVGIARRNRLTIGTPALGIDQRTIHIFQIGGQFAIRMVKLGAAIEFAIFKLIDLKHRATWIISRVGTDQLAFFIHTVFHFGTIGIIQEQLAMRVLIGKRFQAAFIADDEWVTLFHIIATVKVLCNKAAISRLTQQLAVVTIGHFGIGHRSFRIEIRHHFFFFFSDEFVSIVAQATTTGTTCRQAQDHTHCHHPHFHCNHPLAD